MNQQSSSNFTGMAGLSGRGGSSAMGNAMRQQPQYSGANMGLRQQGPMMAGGRGNMMQTGMRGGMAQMGQMHQQRMHNMQAQRMQMQSQQHMQQMQQQMGIEGEDKRPYKNKDRRQSFANHWQLPRLDSS